MLTSTGFLELIGTEAPSREGPGSRQNVQVQRQRLIDIATPWHPALKYSTCQLCTAGCSESEGRTPCRFCGPTEHCPDHSSSYEETAAPKAQAAPLCPAVTPGPRLSATGRLGTQCLRDPQAHGTAPGWTHLGDPTPALLGSHGYYSPSFMDEEAEADQAHTAFRCKLV